MDHNRFKSIKPLKFRSKLLVRLHFIILSKYFDHKYDYDIEVRLVPFNIEGSFEGLAASIVFKLGLIQANLDNPAS